MATIPGTAPVETAPAAQPTRGAAISLVIICAAVFLTALDQTVVVTALLPISNGYQIDFQGNVSKLSWIVSGYLLGYVIVMPLMGRVSDLWGRRRVLVGCLGLFALGSLMCVESIALSSVLPIDVFHTTTGNSSALTWLVLARFLQAVGGGAVVPVAIASIGDLFGARRRILALGVIGGVTEAGGALGPLYGALILQQNWGIFTSGPDDQWRWIFILNVPLVVIIGAALLFLWQKPAVAEKASVRIDWLGALILGGALLCISLGLSQQAGAVGSLQQVQASQSNPLLLVAAVALLALFVVVEAMRRDPVIPLSMFRSGAFSAGATFSLLLGMVLIIALVSVPLYILDVTYTNNYIGAGLALLRLTVMIPLGAFGGGVLVSRFGCRIVGAAGTLVTAIGLFIMHLWPVNPNWTLITLGTVVSGAGLGLIIAPISTTALNASKADRFGVAASVVTALRMIGMILGLAGISSWGVGEYQRLNAGIIHLISVSTTAYTNAVTAVVVQVVTDFFLIGSVLALIAVIPALFLWRPKPGEVEQPVVYTAGL
jgi:MFS family permease